MKTNHVSLLYRLQASLRESAMGQNKVCTSNTYGYPEAR